MQPLDRLDPARLRALRGVAFDIDDTLTDGGRLGAPAFEALWHLAGAGLALLALTGRPLGWADAFAATWPVLGVVGENGAGWSYRHGGALVTGYRDPAPVRESQQRTLRRIAAKVEQRLPGVRTASDQAARRCDLAFDVGEATRQPPAVVRELAALIEGDGARATVSSVHCHAVPGDWTKASGACGALAETLGLSPKDAGDTFLFVGDSGNDAAAFAFFRTTVGVANVQDHLDALPTPPAFVTASPRGQGFVELAGRILQARRG
ncbi:MAG: HAD family hydrolase [Sandaracinaceae bacterium]